MKTLPTICMTAALLAGGVLRAEKAAPETKAPALEEESASEATGSGISSSVINGKANVKYHGKEVWKGKVTGPLTAIAQSINDDDDAAAFDGEKLLWENRYGAGEKLRPELLKRLEQQKKLWDEPKKGAEERKAKREQRKKNKKDAE